MNCFLFNSLSDSDKSEALKFFGAPVFIEKSGELYKKGFVGIMDSGKAKIKRKTEGGNVTTVRTINSGEIFGVATVFGEWQEGFSSITAETKCEVYYIDEISLKSMMLKLPQISFNYITFLTEKIRFLNRRIDAFCASDTEHRIYEFLVSQGDENGFVELGYGMAELARRLKIGRSSLYRSLETLEKNGFIKRNNHSFQIKQ